MVLMSSLILREGIPAKIGMDFVVDKFVTTPIHE